MGLLWKRLPDRTFLPTEDKSAPVQSCPRSDPAARWQRSWQLQAEATAAVTLREAVRARGLLQAQPAGAPAVAQEGMGDREPLPGVVRALLLPGRGAVLCPARPPGESGRPLGQHAHGVPAQAAWPSSSHLQGALPEEGLPPAGGVGRRHV
uniref:Uncharacterized protein n=1 Tax=Rousettus aegyptiacus TaxID=9407 RepID=A0A7J8CIJ1_ROUAE|nr:hypothetical protein HJG63_009142 [Rousettus aegyptiacus]